MTYELEFHRRSHGTTYINGTPYPIEKDVFIFNRPGDIRSSIFEEPDDLEIDFFYFVLSDTEANNELTHVLDSIPHRFLSDTDLQADWNKLTDLYRRQSTPLQQMKAYLGLLTLLTRLADEEADECEKLAAPSVHQQALYEAIRYMREHLRDGLSVQDMAMHIGYSPSHFTHLFKSYTHHAPHEYYTFLKICEAKYLLLNTSKSVSQIAQELSFGKVCRFGAAFKKACGVTPGQFRKSREALFYHD